jgi:cytochrome c5
VKAIMRAGLASAVIFLVAVLALAQARGPKTQADARLHNGQVASNQDKQQNNNLDKGEHAFQTHCGRCHNPPQQLSPKAAGSVLRHMRVRATLSEEDEQAILHYIAPQ